MTNEQIIRSAYQRAEVKDVAGWINCFTEDGTFTDESVGVTYRGNELSRPVEVYAAAFPEIHRELYRIFVDGERSSSSWHCGEHKRDRWNCAIAEFCLLISRGRICSSLSTRENR